MPAILLGLSASVCWGTADFFGGLQSRRLSALAVALWSQLVGGSVLLAALLILQDNRPLHPAAVAWGAAGGLCGGLALLLFYRALAEGAMSIVAPISACGAIVPLAVASLGGAFPSPRAMAGIGVALVGVLLACRSKDDEQHPSGRPALVVLLSLGAALGFGLYYVMLNAGASTGSSPLRVIAGGRAALLVVLAMITLLSRERAPWPGRDLPALAVIGVVDTLANGLFTIACARGNLGVVGVLGSMYPVATVMLARFVLAERLSRMQRAGVILALLGVAVVAVG